MLFTRPFKSQSSNRVWTCANNVVFRCIKRFFFFIVFVSKLTCLLLCVFHVSEMNGNQVRDERFERKNNWEKESFVFSRKICSEYKKIKLFRFYLRKIEYKAFCLLLLHFSFSFYNEYYFSSSSILAIKFVLNKFLIYLCLNLNLKNNSFFFALWYSF